MKLNLALVQSQRDPQWNSTLLGYNTRTYTIGSDGCLITTLGNYVGKNPLEVNDLLKANKGFTDGSGILIWAKAVVLGIQQVYQSPFYDGPVTSQGLSKMRSLLDEGRPLVTHIDFNPATNNDDMHWLLVYGYDANDVFYAIDPWTGSRITLDVYGGASRCVIEWRAYDKIVAKEDTVESVRVEKSKFLDLERCKKIYNAIRAKIDIEDNEALVLAKIDMLNGYEDVIREKDQLLKIKQNKITELEGKLTELSKKYEDLVLQHTEVGVGLSSVGSEIKETQDQLTEAKKDIKPPSKDIIDGIGSVLDFVKRVFHL